MFDWFKHTAVPSNEGMSDMTADFASMLEAGRTGFDMAADTLLSGSDPEAIREDLFATDKQINEWEMRIRRHLVVHASLHGMTAMPACLVLMAIVKDAERIGDYAKNLFDLTPQSSVLRANEADHRELGALKEQLSSALASTRQVFGSQDEAAARGLMHELNAIEDLCDTRVESTLSSEKNHPCPATVVLAYRYFKRVASHAMNVTSSIFMPLDKIDYFDEKPRPKEG